MPRRLIQFPQGSLDGARRAAGLTNDQVVERLGVGETTWMRWKRSDEVPVERVTDVVLLLGLEEPEGLDGDVPRTPWTVLRAIEDVRSQLEQLQRTMTTPKPRKSARDR